ISREPFPQYVANIGGSTVRVLLTGMGANLAARALRIALESPVDVCISSGFAGALQPGLPVGQVLAARLVRRGEKDLLVASDRELLSAAQEAGARSVDRFLTAERVLASATEKMSFMDEAEAVEMESFVILAEAARHGVRAIAIRAVSDAANTSMPF